MYFAGIDWADDHHDVVVIDDAGITVARLQVSHTAEGLQQLTTFLRDSSGQTDASLRPDQVACIVETNHGLLIAALLEAGFAVYPVNPTTLDRRRSPARAKTDKLDAYLLAKTGRSDLPDLRRLRPDGAVVQELTQLTRDQDRLIQSQTRLVNQLTACLKAYYPVALTLFAKLQQKITVHFLQTYPTPADAQAATVEELAATLKQHRHPHPQQQAQQIWQKLHQPALQADVITTRTKARLMLALVSQMLPVLEQIAAYATAITQVFETHAAQATFTSLPGAGTRRPRACSPNGAMLTRAMRPPPMSRHWRGLLRCRIKAVSMRKCITGMPAANRCATCSINSHGHRPVRKPGRGTITDRNGRKGKATVWPCAAWPIFGCAFSSGSGSSRPPTTLRPF